MPINVKEIARSYFENNPDKKDGVMKAYYAYHAEEHEDGAHKFRWEQKCLFCGRTPQMTRHDNLPGECQKRPRQLDVESIISGEEDKYQQLLSKAEKEIPKIIKKLGQLSGKTLAILHHTHGYDPEVVADIIETPSHLLKDYYAEMEKEKFISRAKATKTIIKIQ